MSWCDKLASTASAGLKLDFHFAPGEEILHAFSPILDKLVRDDKENFTMERLEPFIVVFNTLDGFRYGAEPSKLNVTFNHRIRAKQVSAGPPQMEMLSSALPFTKLLPDVLNRLTEAALLLPSPKSRTVQRVGIVSTTAVAEDEIPPGIVRFIEYVGRPWKGSIEHFNINISVDLGKMPGWTDRCIHTLVKSEDPEKLITLQFDWQRTFATGRPITAASLKEVLETAQKPALDYFEDIGEGGRFDEEVIRTTKRV